MCYKILFAYLSLLLFDCSGQKTLNIRPFPTATVTEEGSVTFTCTYSNILGACPSQALFAWFLNNNQTLLLNWRNNACFFGLGNAALNYTCSIAQNKCEITLKLTLTQVQRQHHGDVCGCRIENMQKDSSIVVNVPISSVYVISPTASPVTVSENSPSTFVCETSAGRPQSTITWYKQLGTNAAEHVPGGTISAIQSGTLVKTRSTLQLTPTRSDHDYRVYCTANTVDVSPIYTSTNKPQLYVQYAPDNGPVIEGQTVGSTFYILDGRQQSLTCSKEGGRPLATLSWNCFSGAVQNQSTETKSKQQVIWTAVMAHDGQQCTCQASHPVWATTQQVYVTFEALYPPTSPTFTVQSQQVSSKVNVIESNSVSVTCGSTSNPPPIVSWDPRGSSPNSDILTLTSVSTSNTGGEYTCTVANTMKPTQGDTVSSSSSESISLNVLYPPNISHLTNDTAVENATYSKNCSVTPGNPDTTDIEWIKVKDNVVLSKNQILTIGRLSRGDAGSYRCMARNTMQPTGETAVDGTDSATFILDVYYSTSITEFTINGAKGYGPFIYNENTTVTITCVVDSNPGSNITISRDGSEMKKVTNRRNTNHTIEAATCFDAGMFSCRANNQYNGNTNSTIYRQLYFRCLPRPLDSVNNYTYYNALNVSVTLNLSVIAYPEPTSYRWFKQDREITFGVSNITIGVSRSGHQTNLTLEQIAQDDLGQYKVVVTNSQGILEHLFYIAARDQPQKPTNVTIGLLLHDSTEIQWIRGFNGGEEQTFFIEYWPLSHNSVKTIRKKSDTEESPLSIKLTKLTPRTKYTVQVFAGNSIGNSTKSEPVTFTTNNVNNEEDASLTAATAGGGIAVAVFTLAVSVVVFLMIRRRKNSTNSQKSVAVVYENTLIDRGVECRTDEPVVVGGGTYEMDSKNSMEPHSNDSRNRKNDTNSQKSVAVVYENTMIDRSVEYRTDEPVIVGGGTYKTDSKDSVEPHNNDSRNRYTDAYETLNHALEHQRQYESLQNPSEKDIAIVMEPPKVTESAILLRDLEEVVFSPDSADGRFSGEFQNFRGGMTKKHNAALQNRSRNKYKHLYAYDDTRVVLDIWDDDSDTDYINACYIQGFKKTNAYIASQGPIKNNLNDFWRMVWQTNAAQIVMLTNIIEHDTEKCIKYWPEDGSETYGRITVTLAARETFSSFVIRTFMVNKDFEPPRQVQQFHFTAWPDKDVPAFCSSLVHFRSKVKAAASVCDGPVVVHCSAGIGRTGTYIAVDYLVDEAKELGYVDVVGCVTALREQRVFMVQKEKQYVFVHLSLVEILLLKTSVVSTADFVDSYKHLLKPVNGIRQIDAEFELLWKLSPKVENMLHSSDDSLIEQNVIKDFKYMPRYSEPGKCRYGEFIDAAFLPLYRDDNAMIIATTPTEWTIETFWNLVYHQQVHTIVMMNQEGVYWPGDNGTITHGDITISNNGAVKKGSHYVVKLKMLNNGSERDIQLLLFGTWGGDEAVPDDPSHVLSAHDIVSSNQIKTGNHPIVVHCMDGVERSGLFCVVAALLDRAKIEQDVAISQVIQEIRNRRKNVIPNVEQFEFCHDVVCAFLQQFDSYSNFTFGE